MNNNSKFTCRPKSTYPTYDMYATNQPSLPSDNKADRPAISDAYITAQSHVKKSNFRYGGQETTYDVIYCVKNANKTIDAHEPLLWIYIQTEDSRSLGDYVFYSIADAIESAKKRITLKKTSKSTWSGKAYIYSRDAVTKEEFLVATVVATKTIKWFYKEDKN